MLELIYGRSWRQNADHAIRRICACAKRGEEGNILIVPEQNSFDAEWRLCAEGGDTVSRFAEVLSFTRLASRVFSVYGGAAVPTLDKSGRLMAMAAALEQVRPRLQLYGRHIAKPEFLLELLSLVDEFHGYGLSPEAIRETAPELSELLGKKLQELSLIVETYDLACSGAKQDPSSVLTRLKEALHECGYAGGKRFVVEGFSDFTGQELDVLETLMQNAVSVAVYLTCDGPDRGPGVFSLPRKTAQQLRGLARLHNIPVKETAVSLPDPSTPLDHLREGLFSPAYSPVREPVDRICLQTGQSVYDECLAAAARIRSLVENGARYRDIGVAYSENASYAPVTETLLARYEIPYYVSGARELLKKNVIRAVVFALESAACGMEAESVAEYLKSGYAPIGRNDADLLENYTVTWNIHGSVWDRPFTLDPAGLRSDRRKTPEELAAVLAPLNRARETAVGPLLQLRADLSSAKNTAGQVLALEAFLERIGLEAALRRRAEESERLGDLQNAGECSQLYEILLSTMEQIYGVIGGTVRTPEEFCRFFRTALSQNSVSSIPAALDCVRVGDLDAMRSTRVKHLLVLGASDGKLPACGSSGGLLSDQERTQMKQAGLQVGPDGAERMDRELLKAFTVFTAPTESLWVSCDEQTPGFLFSRLEKLFPACDRAGSSAPPVSQTQAEALVAARPSAEREDLLRAHPELRAGVEDLLTRAAYQPGSLSPETVEGLYGKTLFLSSSRIDRFAECPMAHFLRYGLKAEERKQARVDAAQYGLFVHYVLEHTVLDVNREGGFRELSEDRVLEIARFHCDRYAEEYLSDLTENDKRAGYLFRRNYREVEAVVRELYAEMHQSAFDPVSCELKFEQKNGTAISVEGALAKGILEGVVDRVDLYTDKRGRTYLRVVDYKTGHKEFDYTDILSGVGLQMLIYLFALTKSSEHFYHTAAEPAGVMYFPARWDAQFFSSRPTEEEVTNERRKSLKRKGLLLEDDDVLWAMEPQQNPRFLSFKYVQKSDSRTGKLASAEQIRLLEGFVKNTLCRMTDEIYRGRLAPEPYWRGDYNNACKYCEYKQVCHIDSGEVELRKRKSVDADRFWSEIGKEERHG